MNPIDSLVALFSRFPGIGKKSALRMAWFLLESDASFANQLAHHIAALKEAIFPCSICGSWSESDPCPICTNPSRDKALLCVVERPQDVRVIEDAREFNGLFHVLGGVIAPLEGMGPEKLNIAKLIERVQKEDIRELILALNPTVEGDTTALYLQRVLKDSPVLISRLASGIPVGGDLEYADRLTLSHSFRGRIKLGP